MTTLNLFSFEPYDFSQFNDISINDFKQCEYVILGHFTSSAFIDSIMENGLLPSAETKISSNDDLLQPGDENYIYFTSYFDPLYGENAVKKYGGQPILVLVRLSPSILELGDLFNRHTSSGIKLTDLSKIFEELKNPGAAQARTRKNIPASDIIDIIDVNTKEKFSTNENRHP